MTEQEYLEFFEDLKKLCCDKKIIDIEKRIDFDGVCIFVLQDDEGNKTKVAIFANDLGCWLKEM